MKKWRNRIFKEIFRSIPLKLSYDDLQSNHKQLHGELYVGAKDRKYQLWERDPLSIPLYSQKIVEQKINYIHFNPVHRRWNLSDEPQNYKYSSAKFYYEEIDEFGFIENYMEVM